MNTRIGSTIVFGGQGNSVPYQLEGWSVGEDGFTWTLDVESSLVLPAPDAPRGFYLELTADPLILPVIPSQTLTVVVNGKTIASEAITFGAVYSYYCPPITGSEMRISFFHPNHYRGQPHERQTAFAMRRLRVLELLEDHENETKRESALRVGGIDDVDRVFGMSCATLVSNFEMLSGDCEFGGLQRYCQAEPLGLLRFAGASQNTAIRGLDSDFVGIGENLDAEIAGNDIAEWMILDKKYGLQYHSMISSREISREDALRREAVKVSFLKRKFLEDLSEPYKIFVFADRQGLQYSAAMSLFLALRRKGQHHMLWVQEQGGPQGSVCERAPGLFHGAIGRFSGANADLGSVPHWLSVLGNVVRLKDS